MTEVIKGRIDRSTIEAKLREIRGEVDTTTEAAKPAVVTIAVVGAAVVVGMVYLLGRRSGKKQKTVVEIDASEPVLAFLWRNAVRKGVFGGSQRWFAVAGVIGVFKLVKKLSGNEPRVVFSETLDEGSTLVISGLPPSTNMGA